MFYSKHPNNYYFILLFTVIIILLSFSTQARGAYEIFSASFDSGTDGFTYLDDTFRGTNHPAYAAGDYVPSGGFSGGGLHVYMGGIDFVDILDGLSGGWTRSFTVTGDDVVSITLRYRLVFPFYYEPDECGQALVAIDGVLVGPGPEDYLEEYCGTDVTQNSGWQQVTFEVALTDGTHIITVGGWNSKKTGANEVTEVFLDDIVITQLEQGPTQETNCTDGLDNDGDGSIDCLDSDCNGVSGCEFGSEATCDDGIDNDGDGLTDCADADCISAPSCNPETVCDDGIDNDSDGLTDCDDPDCFGIAGCGSRVFSSGFDSGTDGFTYLDDTFRGTNHPAYAAGDYVPSGGFSGGGLHVYMGGIDFVDILDGLSGGWTRSFTVTGDDVVSITLRYRLVFPFYYEPDECGQALVAIDGALVGPGPEDYLEEYCGTDVTQNSGWQQVTFEVALTDGTHTITVGGWNSKKTGANEVTEVFLDDIVITQLGQMPTPETNCTDGIDNDSDGLTDCDDPDCFGIAGCGSTVFSSGFDSGTDGFTYLDDTFRGTNHPAYAAGDYVPSGGFSGGGLHVYMGGIDFVDILDGLSGGWTRSFTVTGDDVVSITLRYRLVFPFYYEPDECGQALVAIDENLVGPGTEDYLEAYCGTDVTQDSGWNQVTFDVPLTNGTHTITVGGWNSKKTGANEVTEVFFDDIQIIQTNATDIIFFDDFNDGNANGWSVVDIPGKTSNWQIVGGKYAQLNKRVDGFEDSYHIGSFSVYQGGMSLSDYQVALKVRPQADIANGPRDTTGIMFRYQNSDNYYRFTMSKLQGFRRLEVKKNGSFSTLAFDGRPPNLGEETDVTIVIKSIDVDRSKILVYLNSESLFSVEVSAADSNHIPTGSIALLTQSYAEFDNVLISDIPQTPRVILQQPTSFSVPVTDSIPGPYDLQVFAQGLNVPANHGVKFIIDSGSPSEIVDYTNTYSGTFNNVPQGDRTIDALIVDAVSDPLFDPMGQDQDTNDSIGIGGKYFVSMGDSITNGFGDTIISDNNALNGRILSRGYTPILTNLISNEVGEPVCDTNEGLGGTISADGRNRLAATINRYPKSQIWLILFGTNDSAGAFPVESGVACQEPDNFDPGDPNYNPDCIDTFKDNMRRIILDLLAENKIPVLAKVPFVRNASRLRDDTINEYNQVIQDLYTFHDLAVQPPDFYSHFSDPANQDEFYDDTHPNGDGYISIANEWFTKLIQSGVLN